MATETLKGAMRKMDTGDGRKDSQITKEMKEFGKQLKKNTKKMGL